MPYNAIDDFDVTPKIKLWKLVFWSGLIAGLSEIIWISLYCLATNTNGLHIAHQITETLFPSLPYSNRSLILGIIIHFVLSLLSSIAFIRTLWLPFTRHYHKSITLIFGALLGITLWMLNFWVAIPLINKSFTQSLPYAITFISQLIFGVTLAWSICVFHKYKQSELVFSRSN